MKEIKIKYKFEKNYNPKYVNGAIGGLNPLGEIIINFYLERIPIPISTTLELNEGLPTDKVKQIEPDDLENSMIRYIDNGVILNYPTAKEIHRWLGEQIKLHENISTK
jgi:hypothetical protein